MTYSELQIYFDLLDPTDRFDFIIENLPCYEISSKLFAVCDDGDCHLFDKNGNECDINEVKEIEEFKYNYKKLNNIKIPNHITNIGKYTFSCCTNLTSIMIPDGVMNIRYCAFYNCKNLKSIEIPDSVKSIGNCPFESCENLKSVVFKGKTIDQVKEMENYPFGIEDELIIRCI